MSSLQNGLKLQGKVADDSQASQQVSRAVVPRQDCLAEITSALAHA